MKRALLALCAALPFFVSASLAQETTPVAVSVGEPVIAQPAPAIRQPRRRMPGSYVPRGLTGSPAAAIVRSMSGRAFTPLMSMRCASKGLG